MELKTDNSINSPRSQICFQSFFSFFATLRLTMMMHTYNRHPLAYVVEVQDSKQSVSDRTSHLCRGYRPGRS